MNPVLENLLARRSIRAFSQREIPPEDLEQILKAAQYAPSGMNRQTWQFTAVINREKIQALALAVGTELKRTDYDMYQPQAIIIPSNEADSPFGKEDNACALENIFLAAHSLGIGSVWINQLRHVVDEPAIRCLLRDWGIPDSHTVYGIAALGYPAPCPYKEVEKTGKILIVN